MCIRDRPRFLQIYAGIIPWVFLLGIIAAELAVGFWSVSIGMALHVILLIALLAMAVICWYYWDESSVENSHSRAVGQPVVSATDQKEQSANARMWALYSLSLIHISRAGLKNNSSKQGSQHLGSDERLY